MGRKQIVFGLLPVSGEGEGAEGKEAKRRKRNSYNFLRQNSEMWTDLGEPRGTHRDCAKRQMFWAEIIEYFMKG